MDLELARTQLLDSIGREIKDQRVLGAMAHVRRELFIPAESYQFAYDDRPLPIGYGQTISQPFIVALMTQALELEGQEKVLELGTGSGYQTAILAELSSHVVSVERISELVENAKNTLQKLGYDNIEIHIAENSLGWDEEKPYDAILVTAAAPEIPRALITQLKLGGRLVIPVGSKWEQELLKIIKTKGNNVIKHLGYCRFVPLIGEEAWKDD